MIRYPALAKAAYEKWSDATPCIAGEWVRWDNMPPYEKQKWEEIALAVLDEWSKKELL